MGLAGFENSRATDEFNRAVSNPGVRKFLLQQVRMRAST